MHLLGNGLQSVRLKVNTTLIARFCTRLFEASRSFWGNLFVTCGDRRTIHGCRQRKIKQSLVSTLPFVMIRLILTRST